VPRLSRILLPGLLAFALLGDLTPVQAAPSFNHKVIDFALSRMGRKVGDGECWALADRALAAAGAHRPGKRGYGLYVFGHRVPLRAVQPGDILQFEKVSFKHIKQSGRPSRRRFRHHTAIVAGVKGHTLILLQQNVGGVKRVMWGKINLDERQPGGSLLGFRPQQR
jgi:hypothetical protein